MYFENSVYNQIYSNIDYVTFSLN